jgi:hypothetical protein
VQTGQFGHRVEEIECGSGDEQTHSNPARGAKEQACGRAEIDAKTTGADCHGGARNPEGAFRPLVADDREAAIQGEADRGEAVRQEIGSGDDGGCQCQRNQEPPGPADS